MIVQIGYEEIEVFNEPPQNTDCKFLLGDYDLFWVEQNIVHNQIVNSEAYGSTNSPLVYGYYYHRDNDESYVEAISEAQEFRAIPLIESYFPNVYSVNWNYEHYLDINQTPVEEKSSDGGTSALTQDFFSSVMNKMHEPSTKLLDEHISQDPYHQEIFDEFNRHSGPFDQHIETSIPDFRNNSLKSIEALLSMGGGTIIDIAGSTGAFTKTLTSMSQGQWQTVNLDPNPEMNNHFIENPVDGAFVIPEAFGSSFEQNGTTIPYHDPSQNKYDVVRESMGFQFMGNDRQFQVQEAKKLLNDGGLFLTEEKFHTANEEENERVKDEQFKSYYYNTQQLEKKNEEVGFQGGGVMTDNLVWDTDYEETLKSNFTYVQKYWESGNFMGFAASDDKRMLDAFVAGTGMPVTSSKTAWVDNYKTSAITEEGVIEYDNLVHPYPEGTDYKFVIDMKNMIAYFWSWRYEHSEILMSLGTGSHYAIGNDPDGDDVAIAGYIEEENGYRGEGIYFYGDDDHFSSFDIKECANKFFDSRFAGRNVFWNDDFVYTIEDNHLSKTSHFHFKDGIASYFSDGGFGESRFLVSPEGTLYLWDSFMEKQNLGLSSEEDTEDEDYDEYEYDEYYLDASHSFGITMALNQGKHISEFSSEAQNGIYHPISDRLEGDSFTAIDLTNWVIGEIQEVGSYLFAEDLSENQANTLIRFLGDQPDTFSYEDSQNTIVGTSEEIIPLIEQWLPQNKISRLNLKIPDLGGFESPEPGEEIEYFDLSPNFFSSEPKPGRMNKFFGYDGEIYWWDEYDPEADIHHYMVKDAVEDVVGVIDRNLVCMGYWNGTGEDDETSPAGELFYVEDDGNKPPPKWLLDQIAGVNSEVTAKTKISELEYIEVYRGMTFEGESPPSFDDVMDLPSIGIFWSTDNEVADSFARTHGYGRWGLTLYGLARTEDIVRYGIDPDDTSFDPDEYIGDMVLGEDEVTLRAGAKIEILECSLFDIETGEEIWFEEPEMEVMASINSKPLYASKTSYPTVTLQNQSKAVREAHRPLTDNLSPMSVVSAKRSYDFSDLSNTPHSGRKNKWILCESTNQVFFWPVDSVDSEPHHVDTHNYITEHITGYDSSCLGYYNFYLDNEDNEIYQENVVDVEEYGLRKSRLNEILAYFPSAKEFVLPGESPVPLDSIFKTSITNLKTPETDEYIAIITRDGQIFEDSPKKRHFDIYEENGIEELAPSSIRIICENGVFIAMPESIMSFSKQQRLSIANLIDQTSGIKEIDVEDEHKRYPYSISEAISVLRKNSSFDRKIRWKRRKDVNDKTFYATSDGMYTIRREEYYVSQNKKPMWYFRTNDPRYVGRDLIKTGHSFRKLLRDANEYLGMQEQNQYFEKNSSANKRGVMIALVPPKEVIDALYFEGGEDKDNYHVTLAYPGNPEDFDITEDDLVAIVKRWADTHVEDLRGSVSGYGTFCNEGNHVLYAGLDIPHIDDLRHDLADLLEPLLDVDLDSHHGFSPHMTLAYWPDEIKELPDMPDLPRDFPMEIVVAYDGKWTKVASPDGFTQRPVEGVDNKFLIFRNQIYYWVPRKGEPHHLDVLMYFGYDWSAISRNEVWAGFWRYPENQLDFYVDSQPSEEQLKYICEITGISVLTFDGKTYDMNAEINMTTEAIFEDRLGISSFQKFADRTDVEEKSQNIFDQGGVEFVGATPDPTRGRTLWEFNIKSTSGNTYPLYGDTNQDNPAEWIEWFDVACGCDWGRWNYDRAPDYKHLERFQCSHSAAAEKWLAQNGKNEQDRAIREQESGMQELRFEEPTTGPRKSRPQEQFVREKAQQQGVPQNQVFDEMLKKDVIQPKTPLTTPPRDMQQDLFEDGETPNPRTTPSEPEEAPMEELPPEPQVNVEPPKYEEQILRPRTVLEQEEEDPDDDDEKRSRN